jgi:hypothetical protein
MMTDSQLAAVFCWAFLATLFTFSIEGVGMGWMAACATGLLILATDSIACTSKIWPATPAGVAGQPSFPGE